MKESKRLSVGVYLAADVLEYLSALESEIECSRSFLVNTIIRRHAQAAVQESEGNQAAAHTDAVARVIHM